MKAPEYGTEEYKKQVDEIYSILLNADITENELSGALVLWILDLRYSRAAICEAEHNYKCYLKEMKSLKNQI